MRHTILVVPDKFKGTLTARQAAEAMADGWRRARPADELQLLPMSDGGDGFGQVISELLHAQPRPISTVNAAHESLVATWWHDSPRQQAIVESATIIGLALLPPKKFHPFHLDTFGLAAPLRAAEQLGAHTLLMGIGGSATNDAGFGLARGAGWSFRNDAGGEIERWTELDQLCHLIPPSRQSRSRLQITVAVDVKNPLLGPEGASRVYGPQKGLRSEDMPHAESCLARLAEVVQRDLGVDVVNQAGTGAAGGLGYGLRVFFNATLESGFEWFARLIHLEEKIAHADLVLTGEGFIDDSTRMGKGVGQIARLCAKAGIPCIGLAGQISASQTHVRSTGFRRLEAIAPQRAPLDAAMKNPGPLLSELAAEIARNF